jgi:hypothetical protein
MKTYIIYVDGVEVRMIKARGHNEAEKKAWALCPQHDRFRVSVAYTEV